MLGQKVHAASSGPAMASLGKFPLRNQPAHCEKSKSCRKALCRGSPEQSQWSQLSSYPSQDIRVEDPFGSGSFSHSYSSCPCLSPLSSRHILKQWRPVSAVFCLIWPKESVILIAMSGGSLLHSNCNTQVMPHACLECCTDSIQSKLFPDHYLVLAHPTTTISSPSPHQS